MKKVGSILFVLFMFFSGLAIAQKNNVTMDKVEFPKDDQKLIHRAEKQFAEEDYIAALETYMTLLKKYPKVIDFRLKVGVCYLNKNDEHEKSIDFLMDVMRADKTTTDIYFHLGLAHMYVYRFNEANQYFNNYLRQDLTEDEIAKTRKYLNYCKNGKFFTKRPVDVKIENLGGPVNTEASEYVPCITSDESMLIFTYRGERSVGGRMNTHYAPDPEGIYYEDVFFSKKKGDKWSRPESIGSTINGPRHNACIGLSPDGNSLFIYQTSMKSSGDIYVSHLKGAEWMKQEKMKGHINTIAWEGSGSISADGKLFYFVSERPGGYGGKDIYVAKLQVNGTWGEVNNLGPNVNTPDDEDAPYIHPAGSILHFSSRGHNSMGGYDIFRSDLVGEMWSKPNNLGYPINTTDDDMFYVLSADGKRGYYSSGKAGGYGQQDIYVVEPGLIGVTPLGLFKGYVTRNGKPVEAEVVVSFVNKTKGDFIQGDYISNGSTGKYLINLPPGFKYSVRFILEGFEDQVKAVDLSDLDSYLEVDMDIHFNTADYNKTHSKPLSTTSSLGGAGNKSQSMSKVAPLASNTIQQEPVFNEIKVDTHEILTIVNENNKTKVYPKYNYEENLKLFGNLSSDGLRYEIQIAAYKYSGNFKYTNLIGLGEIDKITDKYGISRFLIGEFKTLKEADDFKKKVHQKGTPDAFVTASFNGKRILLSDLVKIFD